MFWSFRLLVPTSGCDSSRLGRGSSCERGFSLFVACRNKKDCFGERRSLGCQRLFSCPTLSKCASDPKFLGSSRLYLYRNGSSGRRDADHYPWGPRTPSGRPVSTSSQDRRTTDRFVDGVPSVVDPNTVVSINGDCYSVLDVRGVPTFGL